MSRAHPVVVTGDLGKAVGEFPVASHLKACSAVMGKISGRSEERIPSGFRTDSGKLSRDGL